MREISDDCLKLIPLVTAVFTDFFSPSFSAPLGTNYNCRSRTPLHGYALGIPTWHRSTGSSEICT